MRRLVFIISLCVCFALSANGAGAENIARGVRVIVIDAGHGGPKFPGAHYRGIYEKDLNLKVALRLGRLIEDNLPGIKVVYTRKTDKQFSDNLSLDLQARADIANKAGGDLFISIHTNAARSASAKGVETLIMGESTTETRRNEDVLYAYNKEELIDMADAKTAAIVRAYIQNLQFTYGEYSEAMARLVQKNYSKFSRQDRGVKRQLLKVLYTTDMPSVLTEIGFLSNPQEFAYMTSEKGLNEIARALFGAVKDYVAYVDGLLLREETAPREDAASADAAVLSDGAAETAQDGKSERGYTVQLIASVKSVPLRDAQFKSYRGKVEQFLSDGKFRYKYCVGRYADKSEAQRKLKEVRREFRDAFVVRYDGKRIVN